MSDEELYFSKLEQKKEEEKIKKINLREDLLDERDEAYTDALVNIKDNKLLRVFLGLISKFTDQEKEVLLEIIFTNEVSFLDIFYKNLTNYKEILEDIRKQCFKN
ncbi:hypothetical protein TUBRATIS_30610 [Tubulinosema ratisbonensis]|uniref:Uncharacterized protein n=1 Tax=Tubulinosema ratisbonensis TaxID=291195 RepID=A0A437AHH2_9MICR|nr:hypothetical protein TUBRATIS_30610 [Tubulinosema ratisbonensis]